LHPLLPPSVAPSPVSTGKEDHAHLGYRKREHTSDVIGNELLEIEREKTAERKPDIKTKQK
jgi:hypothetical protein